MSFEDAIETSFTTEAAEAQSTQRRSVQNTHWVSRGISSAPLRPLRRERLAAEFGIAMATGPVA